MRWFLIGVGTLIVLVVDAVAIWRMLIWQYPVEVVARLASDEQQSDATTVESS